MAAIFLVGSITNFLFEEQNIKNTLKELNAVSSIQKDRINEALERNAERAAIISTETHLLQTLSNYLQDSNTDDYTILNDILDNSLQSVGDFESVSIFNVDGKMIISTDNSENEYNYLDNQIFSEGTLGTYVTMTNHSSRICFHLSAPLVLDGDLLGVLIIESNANTITSITNDYTGLGQTGETFLAKRNVDGDALFLTSSRFDPDSSFSRIVTKDQLDAPITQALLFNELKLLDATDYRGEKVLAVSKYIEIADWGLCS